MVFAPKTPLLSWAGSRAGTGELEAAKSRRALLRPPGSHLAMVRLPLQCLFWGFFLTAVS